MFDSDRLRSIVRKSKTRGRHVGIDPIERTRRVIEISDEIAAIYRRVIDRVKSGSPEDVADRERLAMLMEELQAKPSVAQGSVQSV